MAPSVSKQKCLFEKAEKNLAKLESSGPNSTTPSSGLPTQTAGKTTIISTNELSNLVAKLKAASWDKNFYNFSRYGIFCENGREKTTFVQFLAEKDVEIPAHIDIYIVQDKVVPEQFNVLEFIVNFAMEKVAQLEKEITDLSAAV
ncbi:hypothetical protein PPACK8108_LOCUS21484 [Phakopsora pachyrhizi]|uniref:Peptidase S74 domain-containing protein n=1 Tax=Phakopsora pachyrhizi TaxID=170000 RepID=A0AAV0BKD2_PHAPC|nr:hypothetical protein PPACK8108_LOCUS21484 [Phakopsora pachyrhizi]